LNINIGGDTVIKLAFGPVGVGVIVTLAPGKLFSLTV